MTRTRLAAAAVTLAFLGVFATPALASAELPSAPVVDRSGIGGLEGLPLLGSLLGGGGATGGLPLIGGLLG